MLHQKPNIRRLYLDMVSDPGWLARYRRDPELTIAPYALDAENARRIMKIIALFC